MTDIILEDAAKKYNVPLGVLEGIAAAEGQAWDLVHPGGEVGRFGLHPIHAPEIQQLFGLTMDELRWRPDIQVDYWVPRIAEVWNSAIAQGKTVEQAAWDVVNKVQAPQAQYREREVSSILQHLEGGEITMAGEITPTGTTQGGAVSDVNEEAMRRAEEDWIAAAAFVRAHLKDFGLGDDATDEEIEAAVLADMPGVYSRERWLEKQAQAQYGWTPPWESALQFPMSDYETQTLAIQKEQADLDELIAQQDYLLRTKQITFDQAATNIANRISATATGASMAQTAEDIRTSQMKRRAPAPNVPGGYQFYEDLSAWTKYGMTPPDPIPVRPAAFPDPWAEMERGRGVVGPTDVPPAEFGPSPFEGGGAGEDAIIQAYNTMTAPPPPAVGMGPTPDILTPGMQPPAAPQRLQTVSAREALPQIPQHPGLDVPSAPMEGQVWLNPISGQELIWRGGQWVPTMSMGQPPTMTPSGMRGLFEEGR